MSSLQLFYVSRLMAPLTLAELSVLVRQWQISNRVARVGGLLVFTGRHFAQVLEGESTTVVELARRIEHDPRHGNVRVVQKLPDLLLRAFDIGDMPLLESPAFDEEVRRVIASPNPSDLAAKFLARVKRESHWQSVADAIDALGSWQ